MRKVKNIQKVPFLAPDVLTKIVPAPTDGWDAISPLAEMDPKRAPILDNWVVRPGYVELRGGYLPFADTGGSSPVETLMVYRSPTGESMFAASSSVIYNVSAGGLGAAAQTGLSSARWQYVNFTHAGATTVLQCVNGVDQLRQYDGSSWSTPSIGNLPGGTSANIIHINAQKRRLWYIMNQSTVAAFMPTDAITGNIAGTLDLGALWTKGGYLVAMASWTIDGGSGPQDYAMFISSRGQTSVYTGTDPTNAAAWSLVGTFDVAPPIGRRCLLRVGSDVGVITQQGVLPISQSLPFDPSADRSVALTARIQNSMAMVSEQAKANFGWQLIGFPNEQLAVLNVPLAENAQQIQYVMNTITGGWSRFLGWNANCFEIYNDKLYWGDNAGGINQGYAGGADFISSITADMQCAFNWFDEPGRQKHLTMVQPLLTLGGSLNPTIAVDTDFQVSSAQAPLTSFSGAVFWDSAIWDTSLWPSTTVNFNSWLSVNALGHALAIRMRVNVDTIPNMTTLAIFDTAQFDIAQFDQGLSDTLPVLQVNAFNTIAELGGAI